MSNHQNSLEFKFKRKKKSAHFDIKLNRLTWSLRIFFFPILIPSPCLPLWRSQMSTSDPLLQHKHTPGQHVITTQLPWHVMETWALSQNIQNAALTLSCRQWNVRKNTSLNWCSLKYVSDTKTEHLSTSCILRELLSIPQLTSVSTASSEIRESQGFCFWLVAWDPICGTGGICWRGGLQETHTCTGKLGFKVTRTNTKTFKIFNYGTK